eukprot:6203221-Pleurochrysis_carterae.AAC.2
MTIPLHVVTPPPHQSHRQAIIALSAPEAWHNDVRHQCMPKHTPALRARNNDARTHAKASQRCAHARSLMHEHSLVSTCHKSLQASSLVRRSSPKLSRYGHIASVSQIWGETQSREECAPYRARGSRVAQMFSPVPAWHYFCYDDRTPSFDHDACLTFLASRRLCDEAGFSQRVVASSQRWLPRQCGRGAD